MVTSTPPTPHAPDPPPDAGVIEDARARQLRQRRILIWLTLAGALAAALAVGLTGGGGGGGGRPLKRGGHGGASPSGGGPASSAAAFAGAPVTQPGSADWSESFMCPLARPDRYLPARAGCVTVTRGDVFGGGQQDLVVIYSRIARRPQVFPAGSGQTMFEAEQALVEVVQPDGTTQTTPIASTRAASLLALAHVSDSPGEAIFLQIGGISSGADGTIYDGYHRRLVNAGSFTFGGDSGAQAELDCVPGKPPKLVQFAGLEPVGDASGPWRGTETTYVWSRGRLARIAGRAVTVSGRSLEPALVGTGPPIGAGCLAGLGAYRTATGGRTTPASVRSPQPAPAPGGAAGLAPHNVFLYAFAQWRGTTYGSGSYLSTSQPTAAAGAPVGAFKGCQLGCDPTVWAWSTAHKRWRLMFVNHGPPGGSDRLIADGTSLLDFSVGTGTSLFRSTSGTTYATVPLPGGMASGLLAEVYRAGASLVAIVMNGNERGSGGQPLVWTSGDGTRWTPADPVGPPA